LELIKDNDFWITIDIFLFYFVYFFMPGNQMLGQGGTACLSLKIFFCSLWT